MPAAKTLAPRARLTSPWRGEGGAPSLSLGRTRRPLPRLRPQRLSDRGAPGGGVFVAACAVTPTRSAIGLGPPTACGLAGASGGPSPWRSVLPPRGGGVSERPEVPGASVAPGGGVFVAACAVTPTRSAIGLGPPTACGLTDANGGPSPWRSVLPPPGGGVSEQRVRA